MLILKAGTVRVGRIQTQDSASIQLRTSADPSAAAVKLRRADVETILTGAAETKHITDCRNARDLQQWGRTYARAGLQWLAVQCIRQALELEPAAASRPKSDGPKAFRRLWNRTALRLLASRARPDDAAGLLRAAQFARQAGLNDDAARHLRRAWLADFGSAAVQGTAAEWKVRIGSWIRADLRPALDAPLLTESIDDEDAHVAAGGDRMFVLIPVRYHASTTRHSLSKTSLRGPAVRLFYGLRPLPVVNGFPRSEPVAHEPIYERMDVEQNPDGGPAGPTVSLRNSAPPRRPEGDTAPYERLGPRERRIPASGWAALVLDVPRSAGTIALQWIDAPPDEIDLSLVRRLKDPIPEPSDGAALPPELEALLGRLNKLSDNGPAVSGATDSLAIVRLAAISHGLGERLPPTWRDAMNKAVAAAGGSGDFEVAAEALRYFGPSGNSSSFKTVARGLGIARMRNWIEAIDWAWRAGERGSGWSSAVLGAAIASNDEPLCEAAIDCLLTLKGAADWSCLAGGSQVAHAMALDRLPEIKEARVATRMLAALIQGAPPESAGMFADYAARLGLHPSATDDPLLSAWPSLQDSASRASFLVVLGSASLDRVWYSCDIAAIVRDATGAGADEVLRERALALLERAAEAPSARGAAGFPLLVARDSGDPSVIGFAGLAAYGSQKQQLLAMRRLLADGYAEEVERALPAGRSGAALIDELAAGASDAPFREALAGLLGRLIHADDMQRARQAVRHLGRLAATIDNAGLWRILARMRPAADIETLNAIGVDVDPSAGAALRWLFELSHMTPQERQRFAGLAESKERLEELKAIDVRRGRLVDGRYGVLAVVETVTAVPDGSALRWLPPRRVTIEMPDLRLELDPEGDRFAVKWNDQILGHGLAIAEDRVSKAAAFYYGVAESLDAAPFTSSRPVTSVPTTQPDGRCGPLMLPSRRSIEEPGPGEMTIDIAPYLRSIDESAFSDGAARTDWPEQLPITLRYYHMGGFTGSAARRPWPEPRAGDRHLVNVMLVIERRD